MMQKPTSPEDKLFDRIGGAEVVAVLVDGFYQRMDGWPEMRNLRALHPADLAPVKSVLRLYLGEWLGGPADYSAARGHPRLRRRHQVFRIGPAERDRWLLCMQDALKATVPDETLRADIFSKFSQLADWLRNDEGSPHDHDRSHCICSFGDGGPSVEPGGEGADA